MNSSDDAVRSPLGWDSVIPVWWSFAWRVVVYTGLWSVFIAFAGGSLGIPQGGSVSIGAGLFLAASWLVGVALSVLAFRQALAKHLRSLASLVR